MLVTVPTADETFTASAYVPVRSAADIAAEKASPTRAPAGERRTARRSPPNVMYGAVGAIGVGLLGMIIVMAMGRGRAAAANVTLSAADPGVRRDGRPGQSGPRARRRRRTHSPARPDRPPRRRWPTTRTWRRGSRRASRRPGWPSSRRSGCCSARPSLVGGGLVGLLLAPAASSSACWSSWPAIVGPWIYLRMEEKRRLKAFGDGPGRHAAADVGQPLRRALTCRSPSTPSSVRDRSRSRASSAGW